MPEELDRPSDLNGKALRTWRKSRGLSREQLATLLGVAPETVKGWERGKVAIPSPEQVLEALMLIEETIEEQRKRP